MLNGEITKKKKLKSNNKKNILSQLRLTYEPLDHRHKIEITI
jgi:hypothetical protein